MPIDEPEAEPVIVPDTIENDAAYFQRRAEEELDMAQKATLRESVAIHVALADAYLERAKTISTNAERSGADEGSREES